LKTRLKKERNQSLTSCKQLKLVADGKRYFTDVMNAEEISRLIQLMSVASVRHHTSLELSNGLRGQGAPRPYF
jgi:hypothetical protein